MRQAASSGGERATLYGFGKGMHLERVGAEGTLKGERPRLLPGAGRGRGPAGHERREGEGPEEPPVYLLGAGEAHWHRHISQMPDLTVSVAAGSGSRAYSMAGVRPEDVDVAILYDAFTINTLLFLEDLGFCEKGEGGAFV